MKLNIQLLEYNFEDGEAERYAEFLEKNGHSVKIISRTGGLTPRVTCDDDSVSDDAIEFEMDRLCQTFMNS